MAVVGEATIVVRAITNQFERDLRRGLGGANRVGYSAGRDLGRSFARGFNANQLDNMFTRVSRGIGTLAPNADRARNAFATLARTGYVAGTAMSSLVASIGSLIGGLGSFIGVAGGAIGSLAALGSAGFAAASGFIAASLALSGVGKAYAALGKQTGGGGGGGGGGGNAAQQTAAAAQEAANKRVEDAERNLARTIQRNRESLIDANDAVRDAQLALNKALADGREEIQQLGFDAEDAALSEQRAAIELEKARERLAKVQDLPPNSRARREAELAYQEAELNYRKAKDSASDLAAEQDRLAKTGVAGTEGVIDAQERLADAEEDRARAARDAAEAQADAERAVAEAKEDARKADEKAATAGSSAGGGGGGADPFAGLNAAQIEFVKRLQELRDEFEELERVAAENFLPKLADALDIVFSRSGVVFPVLRDGIAIVASAMGDAALEIANTIAEANNLADFAGAFAGSGDLIRSMGEALGNVWGVGITLVNEAMPLAQRYFDFLNDRLGTFDAWLDTTEGRNELRDFFQKSADAMAQFGRIFDNIFQGIGKVISANLGPGTGGQYLLDWLETATQKFADLDKLAGGSSGLNDYFLGAATNLQKMFSSIGALLGEIIAIGDNPAIGEMWDKLAEGAPILGSIIEKMVEAAPVGAELIVRLLEIVDIFTDTVSAEVFFGTILHFATIARDFLNNDFVKSILAVVGPILAMGLAFRTVIKPLQFFGNVALGSFKGLTGGIGAVVTGLAKGRQAFALLTYSGNGFVSTIGKAGFGLMKFLGPLGIIISVIGLLVTAFTVMYKHNEGFRESVDGIVASLMPLLQNVLGTLMGVFQQLQPIFTMAMTQIMAAVQGVLPQLMAVFQQLVSAIMPLIPLLLNALVPAFLSIVTAIAPLIPMLIGALLPVIVNLVSAIVPLVVTIVEALVPALASIIEAVVPVVALLIESLVPVIITVVEALVPLITTIVEAVVPAIVAIFEAVAPLITQLVDALVPIIEIVIDVFKQVLPPITALIKQGIDLLIPAINFLVDVFKNFLMPIIENVIELIKNILTPVIEGITEVLGGVIDFIVGVFTGDWEKAWDGLVRIFKGIVNTIIGVFEGMINFIVDGINGFISGLNGLAGGIKDITGGAIDIRVGSVGRVSLPRLADGGTVLPRGMGRGTIVEVAEAGQAERIEPLDENGLSRRDKAMIDYLSVGGSGTTINVYQQPGEDGEALAERVSRILSRDMRVGAVS